jgi:hypothetical protein
VKFLRPKNGQLICDVASSAKAENKKESKKDDKADFGESFSKNLRGAFM